MGILAEGGGGHSITPIGLYKQSKYKYDIAVYDNNYPDRVRAVHADMSYKPGTKQQVGYDYDLRVEAGGYPALKMMGNIELLPIDKLSQTLRAPFGQDSDSTTVMIEPNRTGHPLQVKITRPDGKPIKRLRVKRPVHGAMPDNTQSFSTYTIPAGTSLKRSRG